MDRSQQPLVSVVTPVYNGEKYLAECIASVLNQSYRDWEYIIVNNCSTDQTLKIAESYAAKDSRIRIHNNQEFVTAIENHHIAFRQISPQSQYCKVVHADDWLFPECLTHMVQVAQGHPSVGLVGAYRLDDIRVNLGGLPYWQTVVPGREICRSTLLGQLYVFGSPSSLLIRSDVVRNRKIFYDEVHFPRHADTAACYEILQNSDFGFVHQVLTYTRRPKEARTSFSRRVNTYAVERLLMVKKYGPIYLTPGEYEACLKREFGRYFRFLSKSALTLKNREFWRYHHQALRTLGVPHASLRLLTGIAVEVLLALLNPIGTLEKAARRLRTANRQRLTV